jgi:hypothetical protein
VGPDQVADDVEEVGLEVPNVRISFDDQHQEASVYISRFFRRHRVRRQSVRAAIRRGCSGGARRRYERNAFLFRQTIIAA